MALDGRIFGCERGHPVASTAISDVWADVRTLALTPAQVASLLAGHPYDLRHAGVSLWLAPGVPAPRVAERAGHSVEVLLGLYAKCLGDHETIANTQIDLTLIKFSASIRLFDERKGSCRAGRVGGSW